MPQIRLRARPQIQVKLKTKIVLTDFISEISGTLHYALLMIPTRKWNPCNRGWGCSSSRGRNPCERRGCSSSRSGVHANCRFWRHFGCSGRNINTSSYERIFLGCVWKNKKRKKKFSMKTSSAETRSVIWLSVWLSFRGQICSCTTPRLDSFQLFDKHSRPFSHGIPFPNE